MTSTDQAGMVEAAAQALSFTPWHLAPEDLKRIIRRQAERVLTAALAGRELVDDLPEPVRDTDRGSLVWGTEPNGDTPLVAYLNANGEPQIESPDGEYWTPDDLERDALTRLAAARGARRMAEVTDDQPAEEIYGAIEAYWTDDRT